MNKRAQESIQQLPTIDHPSSKKIITIAVIAVIIVALAAGAFIIFGKKSAVKEAVSDETIITEPNSDAQQTLDNLAQDLTPEEKVAADQTLNSLAQDLTPEEQAAAEATLKSLAEQ